MCGIVGYIGPEQATPILLDGLARLEYRGYDSAGVAVHDGARIFVVRAAGKLAALRRILSDRPLSGRLGIGHTRWATHGAPTERNAHPHQAGRVVVVHNGILENHAELRAELIAEGRRFSSDTDTEVFAHLIDRELQGSLDEALVRALARVRGTYALVVLSTEHPDRLAFARHSSPLVVGLGQGENLVASDIPALLSHTRDVLFLEDGEVGLLTAERLTLRTLGGREVDRRPRRIDWTPLMAEKGGHKHFMHKEICEQPRVVADTLAGRLAPDRSDAVLEDLDPSLLERISRIVIAACGTSYHAGLVGKYLIEGLARLPVEVDLASEFRYRKPILGERDLVVAISQSGETADTLAAVREARALGAPVLSICNVLESSIPRAANHTLYTRAGPEIGVASTKAFVTQLAVLHLLAIRLGRLRGKLDPEGARTELDALSAAPDLLEQLLRREADLEPIARTLASARDVLYVGRGINYPIALEGALKLKEISYIHAEGYAAGELKHGPIALISETMPVVAIANQNEAYEKLLSNLAEIRAREGWIIALCSPGDERVRALANQVIEIPRTESTIEPLVNTLPLQLLAYHVADFNGTDVDQPRNLAKSVTVE